MIKDLTWKTFDEWSDSGYLIIKGSKGTKRYGVWMFSSEQVTKKPIPSGGGDPREGDDEAEWDDIEDWGMSPMDFGDN